MSGWNIGGGAKGIGMVPGATEHAAGAEAPPLPPPPVVARPAEPLAPDGDVGPEMVAGGCSEKVGARGGIGALGV
jgi:hypothetical protein